MEVKEYTIEELFEKTSPLFRTEEGRNALSIAWPAFISSADLLGSLSNTVTEAVFFEEMEGIDHLVGFLSSLLKSSVNHQNPSHKELSKQLTFLTKQFDKVHKKNLEASLQECSQMKNELTVRCQKLSISDGSNTPLKRFSILKSGAPGGSTEDQSDSNSSSSSSSSSPPPSSSPPASPSSSPSRSDAATSPSSSTLSPPFSLSSSSPPSSPKYVTIDDSRVTEKGGEGKKVSFENTEARVLAGHLACWELAIRNSISCESILKYCSQGSLSLESADPPLKAAISHVMDVSSWVVLTIMKYSRGKRMNIILKFLELAENLFELGDLSTCHAVLAGIRHPKVANLREVMNMPPNCYFRLVSLLSNFPPLSLPSDASEVGQGGGHSSSQYPSSSAVAHSRSPSPSVTLRTPSPSVTLRTPSPSAAARSRSPRLSASPKKSAIPPLQLPSSNDRRRRKRKSVMANIESAKAKKNIPSLSVALGDISLMLKGGKGEGEGRKYSGEEVHKLAELLGQNHCKIFCGEGKALCELKELIVVPFSDQSVIDYLKLMAGCSSLLSNSELAFFPIVQLINGEHPNPCPSPHSPSRPSSLESELGEREKGGAGGMGLEEIDLAFGSKVLEKADFENVKTSPLMLSSSGFRVLQTCHDLYFPSSTLLELIVHHIEERVKEHGDWVAGDETDRMVEFLKQWVTKSFLSDFRARVMYQLLNRVLKCLPPESRSLADIITNVNMEKKSLKKTAVTLVDFTSGPRGDGAKQSGRPREPGGAFFSIHALQIAGHLSFWSYLLREGVQTAHFMYFLSSDSRFNSCRLKDCIEHFADLSFWTTTTIVKAAGGSGGSTHCAETLQKYLDIAIACIAIGDFDSPHAIISGIRHHSVSRLQGIFSLLDDSSSSTMKHLLTLFSQTRNATEHFDIVKGFSVPGYHAYRTAVRQRLMGPRCYCIPSVRLLMDDLMLLRTIYPLVKGKDYSQISLLLEEYHTRWFGDVGSASAARESLQNFKNHATISFLLLLSSCREMLKEEDLLTLSYAAERPREGEDCDLDSRFDKWASSIPDPVYDSPLTPDGSSSIDDKVLSSNEMQALSRKQIKNSVLVGQYLEAKIKEMLKTTHESKAVFESQFQLQNKFYALSTVLLERLNELRGVISSLSSLAAQTVVLLYSNEHLKEEEAVKLVLSYINFSEKVHEWMARQVDGLSGEYFWGNKGNNDLASLRILHDQINCLSLNISLVDMDTATLKAQLKGLQSLWTDPQTNKVLLKKFVHEFFDQPTKEKERKEKEREREEKRKSKDNRIHDDVFGITLDGPRKDRLTKGERKDGDRRKEVEKKKDTEKTEGEKVELKKGKAKKKNVDEKEREGIRTAVFFQMLEIEPYLDLFLDFLSEREMEWVGRLVVEFHKLEEVIKSEGGVEESHLQQIQTKYFHASNRGAVSVPSSITKKWGEVSSLNGATGKELCEETKKWGTGVLMSPTGPLQAFLETETGEILQQDLCPCPRRK